MSDDIVVVDNGSTYETQESAIVAKNEADRAEQWAKYSEEKANLADERAVDAAESSDAAAQAATAAIEAKQYAETAITDENLIIVATDLKSDPSNIKKTAGSIDNVNTVGNDIENVNAVAGNKTNIDAVNANKANIDTVATNIINVNTVAKNIDNVNILAPHTEAMETIAPDIMDVVTVAGIAEQTKNVSNNMAHVVAVDNNKANIDKAVANATNITTVATNINDVNTVATNINSVTAVADNEKNINAVNANATNINAVAGNKTNIDAVNANKTNIDTVATNKANIDTVSTNIAEVKNVSDNMADVKNAVQSAADAQKWAIGTIDERPEGSSKYWAEQAKSVAQISDASESVKGIVRLATDAEAKAGLDNKTAITPKKLQDNLSNNVGRINQLGFNGTLESGVITFTPDQGTYELKAGYEYEIDLLFAAVGSIPDTTQLKIVNGNDTINIVNVLDSDYSKPTTYGAMKQVCRYDTEIGWRWIFNVRYSVASDGSKVFVVPATTVNVSNMMTVDTAQNVTAGKNFINNATSTTTDAHTGMSLSLQNNQADLTANTMKDDGSVDFKYQGLRMLDKNGEEMSFLYSAPDGVGGSFTRLGTSSKVDGQYVDSFVEVEVDANGKGHCYVPSVDMDSTVSGNQAATVDYVKDESSRITNLMNNILSTLYPVGSIYIGTQATCPLAALIRGSAWEIIGNNMVTDLSNEIWINGTGMGLMFTDNTSNSYQQVGDVYNSWGVKVSNTDYFSNLQRAGTGVGLGQYQTALNGALGVCLNGEKSGLIGYLKQANLGNGTHVWKRTA